MNRVAGIAPPMFHRELRNPRRAHIASCYEEAAPDELTFVELVNLRRGAAPVVYKRKLDDFASLERLRWRLLLHIQNYCVPRVLRICERIANECAGKALWGIKCFGTKDDGTVGAWTSREWVHASPTGFSSGKKYERVSPDLDPVDQLAAIVRPEQEELGAALYKTRAVLIDYHDRVNMLDHLLLQAMGRVVRANRDVSADLGPAPLAADRRLVYRFEINGRTYVAQPDCMAVAAHFERWPRPFDPTYCYGD